MARYDQRAMLLQLLQEALQRCTPQGTPRPKEGVRAELTMLLRLLEERASGAMCTILTPMHAHLDALVVPYEPADMM